MGAFIVRRLLVMVPVLLLVTILVFMMLHLAGDPVRLLSGGGEVIDAQQIAALRHKYGLDRPIAVQYFVWLGRLLAGNMGTSIKTALPVSFEIEHALPVTLELGVFAFIFTLLIGIPAGILSAVKRGSALDISATAVTVAGLAIPGFWLGTLLMLIFAVKLQWVSPMGWVSVFQNPAEGLKTHILPVLALGVSGAAINMRQMRSAMLEVLVQDYVRTARAKGLKEGTVIWLHVLKNSLLPIITLMGMNIGRLAAGAVIIENMFAIPGMGRLMMTGIFSVDFAVVQACVLIISIMVLFSNLITDLVYGYIDPRIRRS